MISAFIYPFLISLFILVTLIYFSHKHQFFLDDANSGKPQNYHTNSTPRAGGIGILGGILFLILLPFGLKFLLPVILSFASGIFEDFHNSLSPKLRLFLQILAALSAVWLTGAVVTYLGLGISMPYWIGILFSTFAIVGMMNAVNIIDGFNGLASGIILLILLSFAIIAYGHQNTELLHVVLVTAGATFGFVILNFPKGKIFLGDGGAYMLGFIVAIIGIFLAAKYESVSPWYVLAIFIYPVWEVIFSIGRKLSIGHSPMQPDSYHFHMLIYRQITHNNPLTSLFIFLITLPFMTLSTFYSDRSVTNIIIAATFIALYLVLYDYLYKKDTKYS